MPSSNNLSVLLDEVFLGDSRLLSSGRSNWELNSWSITGVEKLLQLPFGETAGETSVRGL